MAWQTCMTNFDPTLTSLDETDESQTFQQLCGCLVAWEQVQWLQSKGDRMAGDTSKAVEKSDTPLTINIANWLLIDLQIVYDILYDILYACVYVCMRTQSLGAWKSSLQAKGYPS